MDVKNDLIEALSFSCRIERRLASARAESDEVFIFFGGVHKGFVFADSDGREGQCSLREPYSA